MPVATAVAHPNIALCKYWGKRDRTLNLPSVGSLSLTLAPFCTTTTVEWGAESDELVLNGRQGTPAESRKVFALLDLIDSWRPKVRVLSENDFPTAAGLASSSSGFAALALAATKAAGQPRSLEELSVLARRGSGSAARSLFGGWAEWKVGEREDGLDSHAFALAPENHWDVRMIVAIFDDGPKAVSSRDGMLHTQETSPFYPAWVASTPKDLTDARVAIRERDLTRLGIVMERSALRMHASMMAADPPVFYWKSGSVWAQETVRALRARGIPCAWTMDAGPNVKVLVETPYADEVARRLANVADRVHVLEPGGPARLLE
ncbi:diphosphomevalonate decarboxylase [Deltaproteobacteria bacterium]|nr:diphosphomevalonate decarboxylase [Deltaproteobacteria bacterium]